MLSEPLCDLDVRRRIFTDIIREYGEIDGRRGQILIKPHPRDVLDYTQVFPEHIVLNGMFPMEILNFIPGLRFKRVISVLTVPGGIKFAEEVLFLGRIFWISMRRRNCTDRMSRSSTRYADFAAFFIDFPRVLICGA